MQDYGNLAEWVGSIATAVSVIVAFRVFYVTTQDSRTQNRLSWKPHLVFDYPAIEDDRTEFWQIGATNIGKGPALECRYVGYVNGKFYRGRAFAVGAEQRLLSQRCAVRLHPDSEEDEPARRFSRRALGDLIDSDRNRAWEVILCSDIFGTRWRFIRGRPTPDGPLVADECVVNGWWSKWHPEPGKEDSTLR